MQIAVGVELQEASGGFIVIFMIAIDKPRPIPNFFQLFMERSGRVGLTQVIP